MTSWVKKVGPENMAAAVENSTANQRYYCHQCQQNISPTIPDYTCPECESGFIEELSEDDEVELESDSRSSMERLFPLNLRGYEQQRNDNHIGRPGRRRHHQMRVNRPGTSHEHVIGHFAALDQFLRIFNQDVGPSGMPGANPGFLNLFQIHGNLGDYAWGGQGLDSIITRLLDQMEGSGPPPADDELIQSLPKVKITQADVDGSLECPVCKEIFCMDEEVKKLPCKHYFHESCIIPWLKKHDSCPICRLSVNAENTTRSETSEL